MLAKEQKRIIVVVVIALLIILLCSSVWTLLQRGNSNGANEQDVSFNVVEAVPEKEELTAEQQEEVEKELSNSEAEKSSKIELSGSNATDQKGTSNSTSNSSDKSNNAASTSKPSASASSNSSSNNAHSHEWTTYHKAQYDTVSEPVYEWVTTYVCNNCGHVSGSISEANAHPSRGGDCNNYTSDSKKVKTGTTTKEVLVKAAYYSCSCGATKAA